MEKLWKIKANGSKEEIQSLSETLGISPVLANLLIQRDIDSFEKAKNFFRPKLTQLHDPFLMQDMDKAIDRIDRAISNKEKILIYGDYDVDGTTAVALMYLFFSKFYDDIEYYVPDRYLEGYGISYKGIDYALSNGVSLIIALDCGIKAIDKIDYANQRGLDFIICDHHNPGETLPEALAVLDPKRPDCKYPYKELSGCGVGFKLIQAYALKNKLPFEKVTPYLDLVVVSIASDIVPIIDENRVLAYYGLLRLNENPSMGLKHIIQITGLKNKNITIEDIVFKIGPRINAAGRMESGIQAIELLTTNDEKLAHAKSEQINVFNNKRKHIDYSITNQALDMVAGSSELQSRKTTVLFNAEWHKGVVGIVASRIIDSFYKPTIILTESNGYITGSARSVDGYDLYAAINECGSLLDSYGGHMYAAGLTMKKENLKEFSEKFEQVVSRTIRPEQLIPSVDIDTELEIEEITPKLYRILKQFEPFGPGNMAPVFFTENVVDNGTGRIVGSSKEHLKLSLIKESKPFSCYPAIAFNQANHFKRISQGNPFDVAYSITENHYLGNIELQLNIKDIKTD